MSHPLEISVTEPTSDRLDVFLAAHAQLQDQSLSRSRLQALIKSGHILINGSKTKAKTPLKEGDLITVEVPPPESSELIAQDLPLDIIFEDEHLIVLNKAPGMVVHPAAGNWDGTLVNALLHHCQGQLGGIGGVERPGIVHRLDKDTSGCIIAAKSDPALQSLLDQFANRTTSKHYLALAEKAPLQSEGTVHTLIGRHPVNRQKMAVISPGTSHPSARDSITHYRLLHHDEKSDAALILCGLETGRTHQIRVHMKHLNAPLLGDPIYSKPDRQKLQLLTPESLETTGRLGLHAWHLSVTHPATGKRHTFHAPLPPEFAPLTTPAQDTLTQLAQQLQSHRDPLGKKIDPT